MILIGMFDSPFVRRVAVSAKLLGFDFEHRNWLHWQGISTASANTTRWAGATLVLDDGEALSNPPRFSTGSTSAPALTAGCCRHPDPHSASTETDGHCQRRGGKKPCCSSIEGAFRPADKRHEPWVERLPDPDGSRAGRTGAELPRTAPPGCSGMR